MSETFTDPDAPNEGMGGSAAANEAETGSEHSSLGEEHGQAAQDTLPDLVEPQGVNAGSGSDRGDRDEVLGASEPGQASTTVKDPDNWVTGDEPMTGAQRSYLDTLARAAGEQLPADLNKAQASEHIDRLQAKTGRGSSS